jgi:AcrR family transcriptional regulator
MAKISKKSMILEVAKEEFSKNGYELTNLENVAKRCNITKPAIYYHYKDKATLYEAVLVDELTLLEKEIVLALEPKEISEKLSSYIRIFGNFLINNPTFSSIFARELANGAKNISDNALKILSSTIKVLSTILKEGNQSKVLDCKNPFLVQLMIVSTLTTYKTTIEFRQRVAKLFEEESPKVEFEDIIERLTKKILKGLKCEK